MSTSDTERTVATDEPSVLQRYIDDVVAKAPPLTSEQRDRLCGLLKPAGTTS